MNDSDTKEHTKITQEDIDLFVKTKSFIKWIKSFDSESEQNEAIKAIHEFFIENDHKNISDVFKILDGRMQDFIKDYQRGIECISILGESIKCILSLESMSDEMKEPFARLYLEANGNASKYIDSWKIAKYKHNTSYKGWMLYAKMIILWTKNVNSIFSKPIELSASDLHRLVSRRFGDLVSLQNVSGFLRKMKDYK